MHFVANHQNSLPP